MQHATVNVSANVTAIAHAKATAKATATASAHVETLPRVAQTASNEFNMPAKQAASGAAAAPELELDEDAAIPLPDAT